MREPIKNAMVHFKYKGISRNSSVHFKYEGTSQKLLCEFDDFTTNNKKNHCPQRTRTSKHKI